MTEDAVADDLPELPRGIALAWGMAASPQRGPKREMSVERIVEAAVELADREGLGAVSMAAVAKALGFTPMSLYRYVTAKDDLLLLMQEEATGAPPLPEEPITSWRTEAERLYRAQLDCYLRHPWLLGIPIHGTPVTPSSAAWMEAYLAAFDPTPLGQEERMAAMLALMGQARWVGAVVAGYAEAARIGGVDLAEIGRREAALFSALVDRDAYPHVRAALDAGVLDAEDDSMLFGVARMLEGIGAYIERAGVPGAAAVEADASLAPEDRAVSADKRVRAAEKAVREAEKTLRAARKNERQVRRDAAERIARAAAS